MIELDSVSKVFGSNGRSVVDLGATQVRVHLVQEDLQHRLLIGGGLTTGAGGNPDGRCFIARLRENGQLDGDFASARALPALEHGFTHFRLRIHPWLIAVNGPHAAIGDNAGLRWTSRAELAAIGLPAPVRKLLQERTE